MLANEVLAAAPIALYSVKLTVKLRIEQASIPYYLLKAGARASEASCADRIAVAQHSPPNRHCGL